MPGRRNTRPRRTRVQSAPASAQRWGCCCREWWGMGLLPKWVVAVLVPEVLRLVDAACGTGSARNSRQPVLLLSTFSWSRGGRRHRSRRSCQTLPRVQETGKGDMDKRTDGKSWVKGWVGVVCECVYAPHCSKTTRNGSSEFRDFELKHGTGSAFYRRTKGGNAQFKIMLLRSCVQVTLLSK